MSNKRNAVKYCAITTVPATLEAFVVSAMEHLSSHGYEVTLLCDMDDQFIERYQERFSCVSIPMKRGLDPIGGFVALWKMYRLFRKCRFDVVQYATPNAAFYASVASVLAGVRHRMYCQWGIRYVGFSGLRRYVYRKVERLTCLLSTDIRPASRKNMQFAIDQGLYLAEKARVIGSGGTIGVDFAQYQIARKSEWRKELRDDLGVGSKTVFGFVGSIRPDKGCAELIRAFRRVLESDQSVALLLCGEELDLDPIDDETRTWAHNSDAVHFVGHVVETWRYFSAMDVLVHPSYREGFSMVLQEGAAMALPIITTDIPGPSEVIEPDVTGLLVPPRDEESLYSSMIVMLSSPSIREKMGRAGLERTRAHFRRELMLQYILEDRNSILTASK